jgi:hypothetical protein
MSSPAGDDVTKIWRMAKELTSLHGLASLANSVYHREWRVDGPVVCAVSNFGYTGFPDAGPGVLCLSGLACIARSTSLILERVGVKEHQR